MNLEEIRKEIDQLDRQIAQLLTRRMECSNEVAAFKKANGLPIYHPQREHIDALLGDLKERERQVIEKVRALTKAEYADALETIYNCIMQESKRNQQQLLEKEN